MNEQFESDIIAIIKADVNKFDIFIKCCEDNFHLSRSIYCELETINAKKRDKELTMVLMTNLVINLLNEVQKYLGISRPCFNQKMGEIIEHLKM